MKAIVWSAHLDMVLALEGALGNVHWFSLLRLRRLHLQLVCSDRVLWQWLAVLVNRSIQSFGLPY